MYANNVHFSATIWDMRITFGEIQGVEKGEVIVEEKVIVTIPFGVAKLMSMLLQANLALYEKSTSKTVEIPKAVGLAEGDVSVGVLRPGGSQPEAQQPSEKK